jgi:hypothetical protein
MRNFSKLLSTVILIGFAFSANAQLIDQKDVSITLDMQPVLELEMTTPNQIEFVFDEITEYQSGITNYGATILKVSATVNWDLYAVGRSQTGNRFWDQQVSYGTTSNSVANLPLSLLELRQSRANSGGTAGTGGAIDYSSAFSTNQAAASGNNSLFVNNDGSATPPTIDNKYIAGHAGTTGTGDTMTAGTYLNNSGTTSNFYYVLDYRIAPGLPAIFPNAFQADSTTSESLTSGVVPNLNAYAEGGVYTMYVQYVLLEDQ